MARLITARVPIDEAPPAFERLATQTASPLGVVIQYPESSLSRPRIEPAENHLTQPRGDPDQASIIGAGSFAQRILIPALRAAGFSINTVASGSGVSARGAVEQIPAGVAGTPDDALESDAGLLVVATRHGSHADLAIRGLRAGKAVFVEKPPCLTWEELEGLRVARSETGGLLVVGFNRRHAPLAVQLRQHIAVGDHPRQIVIRVNAGRLPEDHWTNDVEVGGGRLLGEGCHFIDLACWLAEAPAVSVLCSMQPLERETLQATQRFVVTLGFSNGSLATLLYTDQGASGLAKEYVEVHAGGRSAVLHDFRRLELFDGRSRREVSDRHRDKGHQRQFIHLTACLRDGVAGDAPDPLASMAVTLAALDAGTHGRPTTLDPCLSGATTEGSVFA